MFFHVYLLLNVVLVTDIMKKLFFEEYCKLFFCAIIEWKIDRKFFSR